MERIRASKAVSRVVKYTGNGGGGGGAGATTGSAAGSVSGPSSIFFKWGRRVRLRVLVLVEEEAQKRPPVGGPLRTDGPPADPPIKHVAEKHTYPWAGLGQMPRQGSQRQ